jgi:DNA-binding transcriptional MerR regulator
VVTWLCDSDGVRPAPVNDVAGVTPRTVHWCHSIDLLAEPPRDASGYRRHGAKEAHNLRLGEKFAAEARGTPISDLDNQLDSGLVAVALTDRLNPAQQRFIDQLCARMHGARTR